MAKTKTADRTVSLVIGMGEIGNALKTVLDPTQLMYIRDKEEVHFKNNIHVMHIAIPYSENFVKIVRNYIEQYNPLLTVVYSTVPVGTCEEISLEVVHSPVEGKHPELAKSILLMPRWLGCSNVVALEKATKFWMPITMKIRQMQSSRFTEFLKLRSTAKYGVNIAWTDYEATVAKEIGMDFSAVQDFDYDYNKLYYDLDMPENQRYLLDPPNGVIGGHCVVPNAELLDKQFPHDMLKQIISMKKEENK